MTAPILITGVGRRIGLALAQHLLAKGTPVIGTYRTRHPVLDELQEAGAQLIQCDFYQSDDVDRLVDTLNEDFRRLRAIIHNASDWLADDHPLPPEQILARMMQIHVGAPYRLNRALAPLLQAAAEADRPADIIHFTDYVADKGSRKHTAYAASKAALANLTLSLASQLAPTIKVNAIAPALILFNEGDDPAYREKALSKALLPWEGGLAEVIASVDYLLASHYITGRTLHLDGGRHLK